MLKESKVLMINGASTAFNNLQPKSREQEIAEVPHDLLAERKNCRPFDSEAPFTAIKHVFMSYVLQDYSRGDTIWPVMLSFARIQRSIFHYIPRNNG